MAAAPNPKAALALVRRFEGIAGVAVDGSALEEASEDYERQVNAAVASDPDVKAFVEKLEETMDEVDEAEVEKGLKWFEELLGERLKYDSRVLSPETLKTQIRLYLAMKIVNEDKGFDFCGLKGQREMTEHVCLGDVPEMLMNDPYDWNGPKEPVVCATEADAYAAVTMQMLKYISGGLPTLFMAHAATIWARKAGSLTFAVSSDLQRLSSPISSSLVGRMSPGETALKRMPCSPYSRARVLVRAAMAALAPL